MSYASEVLADAPVGYWNLDETSGTTVGDSSGNSLTGTTHGSVTRNVAAKVSKGVSFGGTTADYIDVADNALLDITTDFTFECWFAYTDRTNHQVLMDKGYQDGSNAGYCIFILATSGTIRLSQSDTNNIADSSSPAPNDGLLHHIVITRVGTSINFYIDKLLINTVTSGASVQATNKNYFIGIGSGSAGLFRPLSSGAILDEVAWYSTGISGTRVSAHFDASSNVDSATVSSKTTPSSGDAVALVDSAIVISTTTPSGADIFDHPGIVDSATITSRTSLTTNDIAQYVDNSIVSSLTIPSGTDISLSPTGYWGSFDDDTGLII